MIFSVNYRLYNLVWTSLDWLFPPSCIVCQKKGFQICADCQKTILCIKHPICDFCGLPIVSGRVCSACKKDKPGYDSLRSWAIYAGPVQKAIHRIKYKRDVALGNELARLMSIFVNNLHLDVQGVIPVPLGKKRLNNRGYNQASLIAIPLAMNLGLKYIPHGLKRVRETESQVGLNYIERSTNVRNAFLGNVNQVAGKKILLVDDVATTGATLTACACALKDSGASNVYAVTVARALGSHV